MIFFTGKWAAVYFHYSGSDVKVIVDISYCKWTSNRSVWVVENGREVQQQRTLRGKTGHGRSAQFKVCLFLSLLNSSNWCELLLVSFLKFVILNPQHHLKLNWGLIYCLNSGYYQLFILNVQNTKKGPTQLLCQGDVYNLLGLNPKYINLTNIKQKIIKS